MSCPDKRTIDVSQVFLTFCALVGDVDKTATALDLSPDVVRRLADSEGWPDKIRRISLMSKGERPGDFERAQNRALCFVQAHQLRLVLSEVLRRVTEDIASGGHQYHCTVGQKGFESMSCRFLTELSTALEKAHNLSYLALGDTCGERSDRANVEGEDVSAHDLHASVMAALNSPSLADVATKALGLERDSAIDKVKTTSVVAERNSIDPAESQTSV